jgi:FixJ family two-component response regulator
MVTISQTNTGPEVFIVDDDPTVRSSLTMLFKAHGMNVRTFADARSFLNHHSPDNNGCLLLDLRMPGLSGLELQQAAEQYGIIMPIILITGYGDIPMATQAMRDGAFDVIEKPFKPETLLQRVREALAFDLQNRDRQTEYQRISRRMARLTRREREVMALVVAGHRNKEISEKLHITLPTVEAHRKKMMAKLEARTVADIVRFSIIYDSDS